MDLQLPLLEQDLRIRNDAARGAQVYDPVRKRWVAFTPEEHVRQRLLAYLAGPVAYPARMMSVEKRIGLTARRADLIVYDRGHSPWLIAECKAPDVPVTEAALMQLQRYHSTLQCRYWLLTNGLRTFCARWSETDGKVLWLDALPAYDR